MYLSYIIIIIINIIILLSEFITGLYWCLTAGLLTITTWIIDCIKWLEYSFVLFSKKETFNI